MYPHIPTPCLNTAVESTAIRQVIIANRRNTFLCDSVIDCLLPRLYYAIPITCLICSPAGLPLPFWCNLAWRGAIQLRIPPNFKKRPVARYSASKMSAGVEQPISISRSAMSLPPAKIQRLNTLQFRVRYYLAFVFVLAIPCLLSYSAIESLAAGDCLWATFAGVMLLISFWALPSVIVSVPLTLYLNEHYGDRN